MYRSCCSCSEKLLAFLLRAYPRRCTAVRLTDRVSAVLSRYAFATACATWQGTELGYRRGTKLGHWRGTGLGYHRGCRRGTELGYRRGLSAGY
eukprot:2686037-Rhodomonas_salina.2